MTENPQEPSEEFDFSGNEQIFKNTFSEKSSETFIYALLDEDENVLYIGKTKNIYHRIGNHSYEKSFSKWKYIKVPDEQASLVELQLYDKYSPILNSLPPQTKTHMSLDHYKNKHKVKGKITKIRKFLRDNPVKTLGGHYPLEFLNRMALEVNNDNL